MHYKKMAGTAAVFVLSDQHADKPVERQGMIWNDLELQLHSLPDQLTHKPPMATSLALEGLESYDPPDHGDMREVSAMDARFVYVAPIKGWVELAS
ncbi:hypothetical protein [Pseudomaricurvus sp. HS19]|uniref:hypothetical protein n=1 Tax=Pseudomaricurvus sp. HS19 TaxID=2692626 RepID=UPI001F4124CC|nr:hypothetical protein [Pseudomaricurvus sp. HS19]